MTKQHLALDHEDYGICAKSGAGAKQPVEVGIVGVTDPQVAWILHHYISIITGRC